MREAILSVFSVILSLVLVIVFIAIGWFVVWKLFLSKFKFVQELLGKNGKEQKDDSIAKRTRSKARKE